MRKPLLLLAPLLPALVLAACADEPTPQEKAAADQRAIALVEKGNATQPLLEPVAPEPILYPDIEQHDLAGANCNFAPGTSIATRVIARPDDAFMKIDGEIVRFGADSGSAELPLGTRSRYLGREHELQLRLTGEGESSGTQTTDYQGTVTLRDAYGRVTYEATGLARCGS
jgi:hypothetical protein